jgi:hypothetical protein
MPYRGTLTEVSNRATWSDCVEVRDQETGDLIDLSGVQEIVVQVVSTIYNSYYRYDYAQGIGGYVGAPMLIASLSGGQVQIIQTGVFQFTFTRSQMNTLIAGDYNVGITLVKDDETDELFIGQVPVRDGVVTMQAGTG